MSYDDYEHKINAAGLNPDVAQAYVQMALNNQAKNSLNNITIATELSKEASRRKINKLRWHHGSLIGLNSLS